MAEGEILVEARGVSKKFSRNFKSSLAHGLKDITRSLLGIDGDRTTMRNEEFWAVKDVSFQLRRGECLGLIGHNGAGKSTLLKMLNGLIRPDEGEIIMRGRVGALIELGAGFNPILSGRENVYINGQILGFTKKEIDAKLDAIIEFAEIEGFIDAPVQSYSSGMKVRLGFSIAAQMEPDILLIDEVLAVGDLGFKIKCLNRISELLRTTAIIFVSHSMQQVSRISNMAMLMHHGQLELLSKNVGEVIDRYFDKFRNEGGVVFNSGKVELSRLSVAVDSEPLTKVEIGSAVIVAQGHDIMLEWELDIDRDIEKLEMKLFFINKENKPLIDIPSNLNANGVFQNFGKNRVSVKVNALPLNKGEYLAALVIFDANTNERIYRQDGVCLLKVRSSYMSWMDVVLPGIWMNESM